MTALVTDFASKVWNAGHLICAEAWAILTGVLPNAIRWCFATEITSYSLEVTIGNVTKVAKLYLHGNVESVSKDTLGLLLMHGDYSHPATVLHLARIAQKKQNIGAVFSIYLPFSNEHPEFHDALFELAIKKMQEIVKKQNHTLKGVIVAGHSMGGIVAGNHGFVKNNPFIKAIVSIAGRLKPDRTCDEILLPLMALIDKGIRAKPSKPIRLYGGDLDIIAPPESINVRPDSFQLIKGATHLSVLYNNEMINSFSKFIGTLKV